MDIKQLLKRIPVVHARGKIADLTKTLNSMIKGDPLSFGIKVSRYMLMISIFIFAVTAIYSLKENRLPALDKISGVDLDITGYKAEIKDLSYFADTINKKRLFKVKKKKKKPVPVKHQAYKKPVQPEITLSDLVRNLTLVGILEAGEPQAIIEDRSKSKTYYLKVGDSINGILVDKVLENKVILIYKDETTELFL